MLAALGPAAPAHSILVFTRGDELEADDTPLYEFLRDSPPYLKAPLAAQQNPTPSVCLASLDRSLECIWNVATMPVTSIAGLDL